MLLIGIASALAADRFVAPTGSDTASGTSGAPWATVGHALAASANGDRILLQAGGRWREAGGQISGGRQLAVWGSGAAPEITAARVVAMGGTWGGNGAVRTGALAAEPLACYVDGRFLRLARYPDSGFLRCATGTTARSIHDPALPGRTAGTWTGAQVRWRRWSWWWETRQILGDNGSDTLSLDDATVVDPNLAGIDGNSPDGLGSGYYIDHSLAALDAPGEWCWSGGVLHVYPPVGVDPAAMTVEVVADTTGWSVQGGSVRGIAFRRFGGTALSVDQPSTVEGCTFEQIEDQALYLTWNSAPSTIRTCTVRDVRNVGLGWVDNPAGPGGSVVERNLFHRIGVEPGYGGSGSWHASGIIAGGAKAGTIRLNRIVDTGYAGVIIGCAGQTVERNVLVRCLSTLNDGGAIYTNCGSTTIRDNIILDTLGDLSTSHPWWPLGHGIWPEFLGAYRDSVITGNTVYGSNGDGIFLPNNFHCTVSGNVLVDNRTSALALDIADGNTAAQDHTITGNILASVVPSRRIVRSEHLNKWWLPPYPAPLPNCLMSAAGTDFGTMSGSTFIAPASGSEVLARGDGQRWTDLATWASANVSWAVASDRVVRSHAFVLINDTEAEADVAVPVGSWTLADGGAVGATVRLAPFRSAVLVSSSAPATDPPYRTASGIDWRSATPVGAEPVLAVRRAGRGVPPGGADAVVGTVAAQGTALSYDLADTGTAALNCPGTVTVAATANCAVVVVGRPLGVIAAGSTSVGALALIVTPAASGAWSATIQVVSDDPLHPAYGWTIQGAATATAVPIARITVAGTTIANHARQEVSGLVVGTATTITSTVVNDGAAPLHLGPATITVVSGCTATITTQPTAVIAPATGSALLLSVTPSAAGAWSVDLSLTSDDAGHSPYTWTLGGTASAAPVGSGAGTGSSGGGSGGGCGLGGGLALLLGTVLLIQRRRLSHR